MRVNYFITHFPYRDRFDDVDYFTRYKRGGAEFAAYHLALEMAKKNEVNVFTTSINSKNSVEDYDGVDVHRYGTKFRIDAGNISFGLFTKPMSHDTDIVHAHFSTPPGEIAGARCAEKKNVPFVLTYHGDWQESFGGFIRRAALSVYNRYLLDKLLSRADVIISPSEYYIGESRFLGKYRDKIAVIPNGIEIEDFDIPLSKEECKMKLGLPLNKNMILFVGNLTPYKGPDVLVKAMSMITGEIPDVELVFVGSGGMRADLEELSKKLGVEKCVKFAGFVEERLKPLYYKAADVFCLPSTMSTESFGIVNLEAMACRVPIVASKLGGIPDVVKDGEDGLLVLPKDSGSLADAIIYLLGNSDVRRNMGKNGRKKVENYSWEKVVGEVETVYRKLLEI
ncbi:MAG: glycosyltransferase family 4 protein [Methanosarcinaceae archaeon]